MLLAIATYSTKILVNLVIVCNVLFKTRDYHELHGLKASYIVAMSFEYNHKPGSYRV